MSALRCSAEGCRKPAVETLFIRDQIGHVHDCSPHAAQLREWCDVVHGEPMIDGECMAVVCTAEPIHFGQPTPLDPQADQ
jgi:hypothetical protein